MFYWNAEKWNKIFREKSLISCRQQYTVNINYSAYKPDKIKKSLERFGFIKTSFPITKMHDEPKVSGPRAFRI